MVPLIFPSISRVQNAQDITVRIGYILKWWNNRIFFFFFFFLSKKIKKKKKEKQAKKSNQTHNHKINKQKQKETKQNSCSVTEDQ